LHCRLGTFSPGTTIAHAQEATKQARKMEIGLGWSEGSLKLVTRSAAVIITSRDYIMCMITRHKYETSLPITLLCLVFLVYLDLIDALWAMAMSQVHSVDATKPLMQWMASALS
jgi:hypothetical protein